MAEISSTPHLEDPLGAPRIATGPEYLDALAHLGFNAENLNSNIPFALATTKAAASLITNQYDQAMQWQKTQADMAETMARAKNYDSVTAYNNDSLQLRLAGLDQENKQRDLTLAMDRNKLAVSNATIDSQIAAERSRSTEAGQIVQLNQDKIDEANRVSDERQKALNDDSSAQADLAAINPTDPDFEDKINKAFQKHLGYATNPTTKDRWGTVEQNLRNQRGQLASTMARTKDTIDLLGWLEQGSVPSSIRPQVNQIINDPDQMQGWRARSNLFNTNQGISQTLGILNSLEDTSKQTPKVRQMITDLTNAQNRIAGVLADDDAHNKIAKGHYSQDFDADGRLLPALQLELDSMKAEADRLRTAEKKPGEMVVYGPSDDPYGTGGGKRSYVKIPLSGGEDLGSLRSAAETSLKTPKDIQNEQLLEQHRKDLLNKVQEPRPFDIFRPVDLGRKFSDWLGITQPEAAAAPRTPQEAQQNRLAQQLKVMQRSDPALAKAIDTGLHGKTPEERQAAWDTINAHLRMLAPQQQEQPEEKQYGGVVGMQGGGQLFSPSQVGAGSTDTVPAMLTPGEYVVNAGAVQQPGVRETLDQINRTGQMSRTSISSSPNIGAAAAAIGQQAIRDRKQPAASQPSQPSQTGTSGNVTPWWGGKSVTPWYQSGPAQQPSDKSVSQPSETPQSIVPEVAAAEKAAIETPRSPSQVEPKSPIGGGWQSGVGTEFGEVDNPVYGGYTEAGWNKGKWGDNISGWDTEGVALPNVPRGTVVEVMNPVTGQTTQTVVKDSGPGAGTGAAIDLLAGTRAKLGLPRNFKGRVQYRIVSGPQETAQYQHGGIVEEGSIGTRGSARGSGGGGIESELDAPVDPRQRHRRFHPRVGAGGQLGMQADIPDPMQKKLAKLSQDFLGGLSDLIRAKPEMGQQLLNHARRQLAANMGGQPEDWSGMGGGGQERQQQQVPPEAYGGGMTAYGESGGGEEYMQRGGLVGYQAGGQVFPEDVMNQAMLDPESFGLGNMARGGLVRPNRTSNLLRGAYR